MSQDNLMNKAAWDAYHEDYMRFILEKRTDYFSFFSNGGVELDDFLIEMVGPVSGLKLLDTCCAADATQAFSWANLGARVTACDISPTAIRIAQSNAQQMGKDVTFVEDDAQYLQNIGDDRFDVVFATYPVWLSDIEQAARTWHRVLRKGGKLLFHFEHPISYCIEEQHGALQMLHNYNSKQAYRFERFSGTPLADAFGGWSTDKPSVEHFYRLSDLINAVLRASFTLLEVREPEFPDDGTLSGKLPRDVVILATK